MENIDLHFCVREKNCDLLPPIAIICQFAFFPAIVQMALFFEPRVIEKLVEAAGIEPASVNPPHTGDYMFSLSTF